MMCGRCAAGLLSHDITVSARMEIVPASRPYRFRYAGRIPLMAASDPTQKYDAETIPCRSAVTQMGSPLYHDPSRTVFGSPRAYDSFRAGSKNLLATIPRDSAYCPVTME